MTTTNSPATSARHHDLAVTLQQIGRMNVLATSGGRARNIGGELELPVSSGYTVRVTLAANDTYTVQRLLRRGVKVWVKGERSDVHAEELGETVYVAGCYKNREL